MIDSMVCKTYKLNREFNFDENVFPHKAHLLEKGRIILHATHFSEKGYPKTHIWILATQTKPATTTWSQPFEKIKNGNYLDEIDIDDEHWINNHLNKQVRFYLRHSKYLTSRVLFEKHKPKEHGVLYGYPEGGHGYGRHLRNRESQSIIRRLMNFIQQL